MKKLLVMAGSAVLIYVTWFLLFTTADIFAKALHPIYWEEHGLDVMDSVRFGLAMAEVGTFVSFLAVSLRGICNFIRGNK